MIADYVYAQDNQSTLARMYGGGADDRLDGCRHSSAPEPAQGGDRRAGARTQRGAFSTGAMG